MNRIFFLISLVFIIYGRVQSASLTKDYNRTLENKLFEIKKNEPTSDRPNSLIKIFKNRFRHTKRAMAAALAFPLPFGVLALHRIYLGTAAHVPVVYIGTVGGVFGILPFIDFCVLALDRDVNRFLNNGKIFMWINEEKE